MKVDKQRNVHDSFVVHLEVGYHEFDKKLSYVLNNIDIHRMDNKELNQHNEDVSP